VTLCYGVRTAALLAGVEDFQQLGVEVRISTDDGSAGHPGLVTDLLRQLASEPAPPDRVVCCGPEKMMEAAAELCCQFALPCEVSLESPMACGVGICFSCVTRVRDEPGGWDYRRTCIEGPVFDAQRIVW
jgi:dihydroorotate dehydrogenase electron transfer subunit